MEAKVKKILFITILLAISANCFGADIHDAISKGNLEEVKLLIEQDSKNIEKPEWSTGQHPIQRVIVFSYHKAKNKKEKEKYLEIVKYLQEKGAMLQYPNKEVESWPKNLAAGLGELDIVKHFIKTKEDTKKIDKDQGYKGKTPLYWAIYKENKGLLLEGTKKKLFKVIKYLVSKNAKITDEMIKNASPKVKEFLLQKIKDQQQKIKDLEKRASYVIEKI